MKTHAPIDTHEITNFSNLYGHEKTGFIDFFLIEELYEDDDIDFALTEPFNEVNFLK